MTLRSKGTTYIFQRQTIDDGVEYSEIISM